MFSIFKKKSPLQKLEDKYEALIKEAYALSTSDRLASDKKQAEAEAVLKQIQALES